jgi:crescentin
MNTWSIFKRRSEGPRAMGPHAAPAPAADDPDLGPQQGGLFETDPSVRPDGALDIIGQKNELIRVRFANLLDRLEEIRSLKEDFSTLTEPVYDLIGTYPQVRSRLLEIEAVLRQERDTTAALRRELSDGSAAQARLADDLSAALSQLRKAETRVREQDSALEDLRLVLKDRDAGIADVENQLAIESERARSNARETRRKLGGGLRDAKAMALACEVLTQAGWIRPVERPSGAGGGRVPASYEVNPAIFEKQQAA